MKKTIKNFILLIALAVAGINFIGCNDDDDNKVEKKQIWVCEQNGYKITFEVYPAEKKFYSYVYNPTEVREYEGLDTTYYKEVPISNHNVVFTDSSWYEYQWNNNVDTLYVSLYENTSPKRFTFKKNNREEIELNLISGPYPADASIIIPDHYYKFQLIEEIK